MDIFRKVPGISKETDEKIVPKYGLPFLELITSLVVCLVETEVNLTEVSVKVPIFKARWLEVFL